MTDRPDIPDAPIEPPRKGLRDRFALVWLVPILAVAISAYLVWQNYANQGDLVNVAFENASGVIPGETELRYRDVPVGVVEDVGFTEGLDRVVVTLRVSEAVAPYIDDDAVFYVVRPQIGPQGISGIETVLSGVYISGQWDLEAEGLVQDHLGSESAPVGDPSRPGLRFFLVSDGNDGLSGNVPILFKGVEVGRVGGVELDESGIGVRAEAVVYAPYDRLVTEATRFWDSSGVDFSLGTSGARLDIASLASLVSGGVVFDTLISGGGAAEDGTTFRLFPDETTARRSAFANEGPNDALRLAAVFEGEVAGLEINAPVELRGIGVGRIAALSGIVDTDRFGDDRVRLLATLELQPSRFGIDEGPDAALEFLERRVAQGLRARLVDASILSSGLKVQITEIPGVEPAVIDTSATPYPVFPTAPAEISDVAATAQGLFGRLSSLPFEELLDTALLALDGGARLLNSEDTQSIPGEVRGILSEAREVASNPALDRIPAATAGTLENLDAIFTEINESGVIAQIAEAADNTYAAADDLSESVEGIPELVAEITALAAELREVPVRQAVTEATGLLAALDAVVDQDAVRALPGELQTAVASLRTVAEEIAAENVAARLGQTLDAAAAATTNFAAAAENAPALVEEITALTAELRALPFASAVASADRALTSLEVTLDQDAVRQLPGDLQAAVQGLRTVAEQIAAENVAARLSATLAAAEEAATNIAAASADAPAIVESLSAFSATLNELPLAQTLASAQAATASLDALLSQGATQELPAQLVGIAADLRVITSGLVEAQVGETLVAALEDAASAARSVDAAAATTPELVANLTELSRTARDLPLEELTRRLSDLVGTAEGVIGTEAARQLPEYLNEALAQVSAVLEELRAGGTVENVNGVLASARGAADNVSVAAESLPALLQRLQATLDTANGTLGAYGSGSDVNRATLQALRQVQDAADSISSLARAIERRPNSILFGR